MEIDPSEHAGKKLTLRQRKTLERQQANQSAHKRKVGGAAGRSSTRSSSGENGDGHDDDMVEEKESGDGVMDIGSVDDDNEDDPFLRAIGGSIVTGQAYRDQLMQGSRT